MGEKLSEAICDNLFWLQTMVFTLTILFSPLICIWWNWSSHLQCVSTSINVEILSRLNAEMRCSRNDMGYPGIKLALMVFRLVVYD